MELKKYSPSTKFNIRIQLTYKLKDLNDKEIQGSFYEPELLKAEQEVFRIDKVIRRDYKKKQALVSWKGYSDDFNTWIPMKDLKNIMKFAMKMRFFGHTCLR